MTPSFLVFFCILVQSDPFTSTSPVTRPATEFSAHSTSSNRGCVDDNSGKGCCSNGQDFRGCFSACNGNDQCLSWCRNNCWNYWSIGLDERYWNGNDNSYGIGNGNGHSPGFGGEGRRGPGWETNRPRWPPCSMANRWAVNSGLVRYLLVPALVAFAVRIA